RAGRSTRAPARWPTSTGRGGSSRRWEARYSRSRPTTGRSCASRLRVGEPPPTTLRVVGAGGWGLGAGTMFASRVWPPPPPAFGWSALPRFAGEDRRLRDSVERGQIGRAHV